MTTVPAALDALVAKAEATFPNSQVADGQPAEWLEDEVVVIGWTMERVSVTSDVARESAGTDDRERYDVANYITVFAGDRVLKPVRDRAFAMYEAFAAALRADQRLGGAVMRARPSFVQFDQVQIDGGEDHAGGVSATIEFTVACDAFAR